jgi:hypothetical protein
MSFLKLKESVGIHKRINIEKWQLRDKIPPFDFNMRGAVFQPLISI